MLQKNSKIFVINNSKKAISPVVATALLLVVAVVAIVGFQGWFANYSSGMFSDAAMKSNSALDGTLKLDRLIGNTLYIINNIEDELNITELKIGDSICLLADNLSLGMNEVDVSDCIGNVKASTPDIILLTEKEVVSKKVLIDTIRNVASLSPDYDCVLEDWKNSTSCEANFVLNGCGDGTVLDIATNLCWQRNMRSYLDYDGTTLTWAEAKSYCDALSLATHTDWYLPSRQELFSITDLSRSNPAVIGGNNNLFTNVVNNYYWTASTYGPNTGNAWYVYFYGGGDYGVGKTNSYYAVCVRRNS